MRFRGYCGFMVVVMCVIAVGAGGSLCCCCVMYMVCVGSQGVGFGRSRPPWV